MMRQAIRTRYHDPTNSKGSRISAKCAAGTITVGYDHSLNVDENHQAACNALVKKLGWDSEYYTPMVGGGFDGDYYWAFGAKGIAK